LLRADTEETTPVGPKVEDLIIATALKQIGAVDVVILSDYAKCVLTPRVVAAVIAAARRARKPIVVDPKGLDYARYRGATALTPIVGELWQALRHAVKNDEAAVRAAALALADEVECEIVLVTRANGAGSSFHATARRHHSMPPQGGSSTCPVPATPWSRACPRARQRGRNPLCRAACQRGGRRRGRQEGDVAGHGR